MKKLFLAFSILLGMCSSVFSQAKENVARECVLFELFTGVRCSYCPAAANGVAQMLEEGLAIAPVAYHTSAFSSPLYYTDETNARANYYGINSYPTLKADGVTGVSGGGSASESMYSYYLGYYNQRINVPSPFTIELTVESLSDGTCMAHCTVTQVGECSGTNVRVMMALTQSNINVSWQGMQGLHHVCRDMIPNQLGTVFNGPTMTIDAPFDLNWPKEDCYLTAWVQNYSGSTKEVYQAMRLSLDFDFDYDLFLQDVKEYSATNCSGMIRPLITVKNDGHMEVQSFDIVALHEGNEVSRETWTGSLAAGEAMDYQMSEFSMENSSELTLMVVAPNGHEDDFMADNKKVLSFDEPVTMDGYLKMQFKTDNNPTETTVQVVEMGSGEVVREFTFDQPRHVYTEEFVLMNAGCYCIRILDSAGDGLGSGAVFRFSDAGGQSLFQGGASTHFKYELSYELSCDGTLETDELVRTDVAIYPNPSNGQFEVTVGEGVWQVKVFDALGRVVYQDDRFVGGNVVIESKGVYLLRATNGKDEVVRKMMVY